MTTEDQEKPIKQGGETGPSSSRVTGPFLFSELLELCSTMCKSYSMLQLPESLGMAVHMKYLGLLSYRKPN